MSMEKTFDELKKAGYNTVDNIIKWLQEAHVMQQDAEKSTREMFAESSKEAKVELEKFESVVRHVATENKKQVDEVKKELEKQGPKIMEALQAAAKAFSDVMNRK